MAEVITVQDLETLKKHEIFEAEVITGKVGGLAGGADMPLATNPVTGQTQKTLPKVISDAEEAFEAHILNMGYTRVGTFAIGATLTNPRETLLWETSAGGDGQDYGWSGTFNKVVPPGSTPLTTGGIAVGAWVSRFDPELRIQARENIRRSYDASGYTLVEGSFEAGGTLDSSSSVLLHESSGKAYSGSGPYPQIVPPGSSPSASFTDRSNSASERRYSSVADMISGNPIQARVGDRCIVDDYYDGGSPNNSGVLFFTVVETGTGTHDGGKFINGSGVQFMQNIKLPLDITAYGAKIGNDAANESTNTTAINNAIAYVSASGGGDIYVPHYDFYCSEVRLLQKVSANIDGRLLLGGSGKVLIRLASYSRVYGSGALREVSGGNNRLAVIDTSFAGYHQIRSPEVDIRCESYNQTVADPNFRTSVAIDLKASNALGVNSFIWKARVKNRGFVGGFLNTVRSVNVDHSVANNSWIHDTHIDDISSEFGGGSLIHADHTDHLFINNCSHQYWSGTAGSPTYLFETCNNVHLLDNSSWDRPDVAIVANNCAVFRLEGDLIYTKNASQIISQTGCTNVSFWNTKFGFIYSDNVYKRTGHTSRNGTELSIVPGETRSLFTINGGFNGSRSRLVFSAIASAGESVDITLSVNVSGTTRQVFIQKVTGYNNAAESVPIAQMFKYCIEGTNISIGFTNTSAANRWVTYKAELLDTCSESIANFNLANSVHAGGPWTPFA